MLPRAERIGTNEFRRAFDGGRVLRGGLLQLRIYRRDNVKRDNVEREDAIEYSKGAAKCGKTQTRVAFVVSRKTGKATVRNSLRRRVREMYRLSAWRHDARLAATDLLFFASPAALTASNEALHHALNELLERAARLQPNARPFRAGTSPARTLRRPTATALSPSSSPISGEQTPGGKVMRKAPNAHPDDEE